MPVPRHAVETLLAALVAGAAAGPVALEDLDSLPLLREGTRAWQVSSFDRTGDLLDANDDRNTWLRLDTNGEFVLLDESGPGCVHRIWMTYSQEAFVTNNRIRIYLDGETSPRVEMNVGDFFSGTNAPFLQPLVGNKAWSAGGMVCYVPIPYRVGCRIATTWFPPESERYQHWPADWGYYQIAGHAYDSEDGVTTWTGAEDLSRVLDQWTHLGADPKRTNALVSIAGTVAVPAGATSVLASINAPGCLAAVLLDPEPHDAATLADARLQMLWDGRPEPAVDAPIGEFFGSGFGEVPVSSLMIGMRTNGPYYCHFPMPFWSSAVVRVVNGGTQALASLGFEIRHRPNGHDRARTGHFHARHSSRLLPGDGADYVVLDEAGRGHVVGVSLSMQAGNAVAYGSGLPFLEVDERVFVDGARSPAVHGTGLEDYFNCGWYYQGGLPLNRPCHGIPVRRLVWGQPTNCATTYRHHLGDVLPFERGIRFLFEVVPDYMPSDTWSHVVYYYKLPGTNSGLRTAAVIDTGDPASEAAYGYAADGTVSLQTNVWRFPGRQPFTAETNAGRHVTGTIEFTVPLAPSNAGVRLRRRTDTGVGGQRAAVLVDGDPAGTWDAADRSFTNSQHRWSDAEFAVDRGFTAGKTGIVVRLERDPSGAPALTDYGWEILEVLPLDSPDDTDRDGLPDAWEVGAFGRAGRWTGADDPDGDGASNSDEHAAGTDPTNRLSRLAFDPSPEATLRFDGVSNRVYRLQRTSDLAAGWTDTDLSATGTGAAVSIEVDPTNAPAFYRLRLGP